MPRRPRVRDRAQTRQGIVARGSEELLAGGIEASRPLLERIVLGKNRPDRRDGRRRRRRHHECAESGMIRPKLTLDAHRNTSAKLRHLGEQYLLLHRDMTKEACAELVERVVLVFCALFVLRTSIIHHPSFPRETRARPSLYAELRVSR